MALGAVALLTGCTIFSKVPPEDDAISNCHTYNSSCAVQPIFTDNAVNVCYNMLDLCRKDINTNSACKKTCQIVNDAQSIRLSCNPNSCSDSSPVSSSAPNSSSTSTNAAMASTAPASTSTGGIPAGVDTDRYKHCMDNQLWQGHDAVQYCTKWSAPTLHDTSTPDSAANPFTGVTVGVGASNATVNANGGSGSATTGTVAVGYTAAVGSTSVGGTSVIPTVGATISTSIGNQGTAGSTSTTPSTLSAPYYHDADHSIYSDVIPGTTTGTSTQIGTATALTATVGAIVNNSVQLTASAGPVIANKTVTSGSSSISSSVVGTRVGIGASVAVTPTVAVGVTATRDSYSGTPVNTIGFGVTIAVGQRWAMWDIGNSWNVKEIDLGR